MLYEVITVGKPHHHRAVKTDPRITSYNVCYTKLLRLLAGAGGTARAAGADIVVLMDASGTILPWFDQINGRILTDITKKFVRTGDTFHLISFNSRSNLEIVQPVLGEARNNFV